MKRGTGPQGILMGLMLMPQKYHHVIVESLKIARAKIEQSGHFNAWSKFEIERGIRFFEADKKTRKRIRDYISRNESIDDAAFKKQIASASVRPWSKCKIKLADGSWAEVSTEQEYKKIIAQNRAARARAGK